MRSGVWHGLPNPKGYMASSTPSWVIAEANKEVQWLLAWPEVNNMVFTRCTAQLLKYVAKYVCQCSCSSMALLKMKPMSESTMKSIKRSTHMKLWTMKKAEDGWWQKSNIHGRKSLLQDNVDQMVQLYLKKWGCYNWFSVVLRKSAHPPTFRPIFSRVKFYSNECPS